MRMHEITQSLHGHRNDNFYEGDFEELGTSVKRSDTGRPHLSLLHVQRMRKRAKVAEYDRLQYLEMCPEIYIVSSVNGKWSVSQSNLAGVRSTTCKVKSFAKCAP